MGALITFLLQSPCPHAPLLQFKLFKMAELKIKPQLKLYITKYWLYHANRGSTVEGWRFSFSVVDASISTYPLNFVCLLPNNLQSFSRHSTITFRKMFGEDSINFALQLLNNAKIEYADDADILAEIDKRINMLSPRTKNCKKCGAEFKQKTTEQYCHVCRDNWLKHNKGAKYRLKPKLGFVGKKIREAYQQGAFIN